MSALRRFLHTSRPLANPSSVSDIFAQHLRSSSPSGSSSASSSIAEKGRAMIGSSTSRASQEDIGRSTFYPNQTISPHQLSRPSLYPTSRPPARPPLLGPPKRIAKKIDPFHASATDPLDFTLNPNFPLAFVNQMGRIRPRAETGLTWKSQRKIGKMVRRARGMGLISRWANVPSNGGFGRESR